MNARWGSSSIAPSGYAVFEDVWRGLRLYYPEGWEVVFPLPHSVAFQAPDAAATLVLLTLNDNQLGDAQAVAQQLAGSVPDGELRVEGGNSGEQATVHFRSSEVEGRVLVRLTPSGGFAVIADRKIGQRAPDLSEPFRILLGSLAKLKPFKREAFVCPHEQSFRVEKPAGWRVESAIDFSNNQRRPRCRVFDPVGQTVVAHEPECALFLDTPDIPAAPKEEGFFAKMGRYAKHAGHAMSAAFGQPPMPFDSLRPVAERYFLARMQQHEPGIELIAFNDFGNKHIGQMRLRMPDGSIRVALLEGMYLPQMGAKVWGAAMLCWYQAPAELMLRFESVLRGIADGFKVNPAWQANETRRHQQEIARQQQQMAIQQRQRQQMMQSQHQHNMRMLQGQAAAANVMYQANQEISDMQMQGWQDQQATNDIGHHNTIQTIREVTDYAAPSATAWSGTGVVEVSSHYEHVWSDSSGQLFGGDWSVDVPPTWEELKPLN